VNLGITGRLDRDGLTGELGRSDIHVQTSLWDGMPLPPIEAQAAELPAVVSGAPGCRDIVVDGMTDYVCRGVPELKEETLCLIHAQGTGWDGERRRGGEAGADGLGSVLQRRNT
jgi:glycosyltransferase involved in cell wall biosynthesis